MGSRIYLSQINNTFGNNAFLPYSVALLWSYARTHRDITDYYELGGMLFMRESIEDAIDKLHEPSIFAASCYIWNWNYTMVLISEIKRRWPNVVIIIGGPEAPNNSTGFMELNPNIDYIVHGEGEITFVELLRCIRDGGDPVTVKGISYRNSDGCTIKNESRPRLSDVNLIPSPYTDGTMDQLIGENLNLNWHASQETHRGCPYTCTFCDWGSAVYTNVRAFETNRLIDEMEWFGKNQIDLLYNVDANYGIFKRDIDLTNALVNTKKRFEGWPNKFRASYAKKSDGKIFEIAKLLNESDMNKGVTLSMQSMNTSVLDAIKRRNIAIDNFRSLTSKYREANIPTYTELIIGLPEESLTTFSNGIESLLQGGQHDNLNIYMCMLLKNSEMSQPDYMNRYAIQKARMPLSNSHNSSRSDSIVEYNDIVVGTKDMPHADWVKAVILSWTIQSLHCLGITQIIAMDHMTRNGSFLSFYQSLIDQHTDANTIFGKQLTEWRDSLLGILNGETDWKQRSPEFGDINWPHEEFCFIKLRSNPAQFVNELRTDLVQHLDSDYVDQLLDFQDNYVSNPHCRGPVTKKYNYDFAAMIESILGGTPISAPKNNITVTFENSAYFDGDKETWAREMVWYGRKQSKLRNRIIVDRE